MDRHLLNEAVSLHLLVAYISLSRSGSYAHAGIILVMRVCNRYAYVFATSVSWTYASSGMKSLFESMKLLYQRPKMLAYARSIKSYTIIACALGKHTLV